MADKVHKGAGGSIRIPLYSLSFRLHAPPPCWGNKHQNAEGRQKNSSHIIASDLNCSVGSGTAMLENINRNITRSVWGLLVRFPPSFSVCRTRVVRIHVTPFEIKADAILLTKHQSYFDDCLLFFFFFFALVGAHADEQNMKPTTVWWLTWMTSSPAWIFLQRSAGDFRHRTDRQKRKRCELIWSYGSLGVSVNK